VRYHQGTKPYLTHALPCTQSIIIRAQGEAKAAELIGESMRNNKGFLELRRLEAAREIANILSNSGNKVMLDSQSLLLNGAFFPFLLVDGSMIMTMTFRL
jgi:regulator of protease activity HflC (stomatin/prohibitin superfamily)